MNLLDILQPTEEEREWLAAELLRRAAELYEQAGMWRKAAECWAETGQSEQAANIYLEHQEYERAASLLLAEGRYEQALECYRRWLPRISEQDVVGQVNARLGIAACLKLLRTEPAVARETYRHARRLIETDFERHPLTAGLCWEALGAYGTMLARNDLIQVGYEMALKCYGEQYSDEWVRAAQDYLGAVQPELQEIEGRRQKAEGRRPGEIWVEPLTSMEFVWIPAGRFMMGSPETEEGRHDREGPLHEVSVDGFWLAKTPVTNKQYRLWKENHDSQECEGHSLNGDEQPVMYVHWGEAKEFIAWLNAEYEKNPPPLPEGKAPSLSPPSKGEFRLPTEAEWEYACRAGTTTARFWGENPDEACRYANVADKTAQKQWSDWHVHNCETGYVVTAPVGRFQPNVFGLYDMLGNVWEWCEDPWHGNYEGAPSDGSVWETDDDSARVLRGGSWRHGPGYVRCACRSYSHSRLFNIGFRLARSG